MAVLSTSYDVESGVKTTIVNTISPIATSNIVLNYPLTITSGVGCLDGNTDSEEFISFGGVVVSNGRTTLSDVVRGLNLTGDTFTGSSTRGKQHTGGASTFELTNYHSLYNLKANKDRANTFTASQTISGTNRWYFNDSDSYIYDDGADLKFRSSAQAEVSLADLANAAGVNDKVKTSVTDTTEGYLNDKLTAGDGLSKSITNPAGNESIDLDIDLNDATVFVSTSAGAADSGKVPRLNGSGFLDTSFIDDATFNTTGVANDTISNQDALSFNGNTRLDLADANESSLNKPFLFAGVSTNSGTSGNSLPYVPTGPVVTVPTFSLAQRANCRLWDGQTQSTSNTTTDALSSASVWRGETFTPSTGEDNISALILNLTKTGSPSGNCTVRVRATSGGLPTGADLATATLAYSAISTGDNTFNLSTPLSTTPGTVYAVILDPGAGVSVGNTIAWNYQNTNVYSGGQRITSADSGSNWTADSTADYRFKVQYRGIAGEPVFLSDTAGDFQLSPGTYTYKVGYAISTTQIVLSPGLKSIYATFSATLNATGTVQTELTIGFRPLFAIGWLKLNSGVTAYGNITWLNSSSPNSTAWGTTIAADTGSGASGNKISTFGNDLIASPSTSFYLSSFEIVANGANTITFQRVVAGSSSSTTLNVYLYILGY